MESKGIKQNKGYSPGKKSRRDYQLHKTFGAPALTELPASYAADNNNFPDQGPTDLCTAYTVTDIACDEKGIAYSPDFNFSMSKLISGDPPSTYGSDLRTAFLVPSKSGLLPQAKAMFSWQNNGRDFIADPKNWRPEDLDEAQKTKLAMFAIDFPYDVFDSIRSALWLTRNERRSIGVGTRWYDEWNSVGSSGIIPSKYQNFITYHAYAIKGWKTIQGVPYLIAKEWEGKGFGDDGFVYFPREVVNKEFTDAEIYTLKNIDDSVEIQTNENALDFIVSLVKQIINLLLNYHG